MTAVIVGAAALVVMLMFTRPPIRSRETFVSIPERGDPVSAGRGRTLALGPPLWPSISAAADKEKRCRDSWSSLGDYSRTLSEPARQFSLSQAPTDRAVGLYMQMSLAGGEAFRAYNAKHPKCFENKECRYDVRRAVEEAGSIFRETIAKFASTSDDPEVYAVGFYACGSFAPGTASQCTQLSAEQWARLDPNNAVPWLYVAREAAKRGEPV